MLWPLCLARARLEANDDTSLKGGCLMRRFATNLALFLAGFPLFGRQSGSFKFIDLSSQPPGARASCYAAAQSVVR